MDKTSEDTCIKQRRTHISKSVESFQNLMSSSDANLTDLNRLIFDQNDTKKLIDKHQQTNSSNNYSLTIENICWFVLSIVSIYVSDIFRVLMYDSRINRWDFFYWCSYRKTPLLVPGVRINFIIFKALYWIKFYGKS